MKKKIVCLLVGTLFILTIFGGLTVGKNIVTTNMDNTPPNPPEISGPASGNAKEFYTYSFTITDPDEDQPLSLMEVDWGEGEVETIEPPGCCGGYWNNGETVLEDNQWNRQGSYEIKARVMDVYGEWSEWSEPFPVSMPKSKFVQNYLFQRLIDLFPILRQILA